MWIWEGDPIAEAMFKAAHIEPRPLSITDVYTSLQTKLIDAVYTSPLAAIALQWFTRVKYMLNLPLADACGAVVISKKKFDEIPEDLKEILVRNGRTFMQKLTVLSRKDNSESIATLQKQGIQIIDPPPANEIQRYDDLGKNARRMLIGNLYPEEFLKNVEQAVTEFRSKGQKLSK